MTYQVEIVPSAEKEFRKLPTTLQARIRPKLIGLAENPRPPGTKQIRATDRHRIRVGDYRVVYSIDDKEQLIRILLIRHRREVYR